MAYTSLDEDSKNLLKQWLTSQCSLLGDAYDSEILVDYILVLLEKQFDVLNDHKDYMIKELETFINHSDSFVKSLFQVLQG